MPLNPSETRLRSHADQWGLFAVLVACYGLTVVLNWPGHYSVDSIIQLVEGMTGKAVSYNPPLMGEVLGAISKMAGHGWFMALSAGAYFAAIALLLRRYQWGLYAWIAVAVTTIAVAVNPVTLVYNGTVWKDVFCTNLTLLAFAVSQTTLGRWRMGASLAILLAAAAVLVRQQAIIPGISLCTLLAWQFSMNARGTLWRFARELVFWLALLGVATTTLGQWVQSRQQSAFAPPSLGFIVAAQFDIAGMLYYADDPEAVLGKYFSSPHSVMTAVRESYSPERVDTLVPFYAFSRTLTTQRKLELWFDLIKAAPSAYLHHKYSFAQSLLGSRSDGQCLPASLGVATDATDILHSTYDYPFSFPVGFVPAKSSHLDFLNPYVMKSLGIFSGWPWMTILVIALLIGQARKDALLVALSVGGLLYALSFLVVSVACDFRYIYFAVATSMVCALLIAANTLQRRS